MNNFKSWVNCKKKKKKVNFKKLSVYKHEKVTEETRMRKTNIIKKGRPDS